ncbi:MAG: thioredoxin family protein [Acidobacteria bacterium]|nr:thioredoxin family protein [Acidobacteriota bacterium]
MKPKFSAGRLRTARLFKASLPFLLLSLPLLGQRPSPAHWTLQPSAAKAGPGAEITLQLQLKLDAPWHMYSLTTPKPGPTGGPTATTIRVAEDPSVASFEVYFPAPASKFDPNFNLQTETYEKEATFWIKAKLAAEAKPGPLELTVQTRYQLCTEKECLPPKKVPVTAKIEIVPGAPAAAAAIPTDLKLFQPAAEGPVSGETKPASKAPATGKPQDQPLGTFLLVAFGFGLAAIFTPCVFPMIPITMSFFLGQGSTSRGSAVRQALTFCVGIVVLFTAIGFGLSAALGPFAVVQMASSPWVNGVICVVFFAFGLSLLGAFEITLPTGLLTKLNMASTRGGMLGTLIMGLTFCLASFACVGPFMGTLLAASVGGDRLQPVLGMLAFSTALSSPFFMLALFPSFLQRMPRSGGWMSRVKIVLGFLVLAALLKYFANIDQVLQWGLLTRERFLALWAVLFALPGLYLLGMLPMEGIRRDEELRPGRLLVAILLLGFALSLIPGMFGIRLGEIEAYIPAPSENAPGLGSGAASTPRWLKNDLEAAKARAAAENKPILVAFTGYACTNCHWMKANMFPRPEIAEALAGYVLVELYTDGTDQVSEKNQQLQDRLFQTVAIPYYAVMDGSEKVLGSFPGLTKDPQEFLKFLKQ